MTDADGCSVLSAKARCQVLSRTGRAHAQRTGGRCHAARDPQWWRGAFSLAPAVYFNSGARPGCSRSCSSAVSMFSLVTRVTPVSMFFGTVWPLMCCTTVRTPW